MNSHCLSPGPVSPESSGLPVCKKNWANKQEAVRRSIWEFLGQVELSVFERARCFILFYLVYSLCMYMRVHSLAVCHMYTCRSGDSLSELVLSFPMRLSGVTFSSSALEEAPLPNETPC